MCPKRGAVYLVEAQGTDLGYVGSSTDPYRRFQQHQNNPSATSVRVIFEFPNPFLTVLSWFDLPDDEQQARELLRQEEEKVRQALGKYAVNEKSAYGLDEVKRAETVKKWNASEEGKQSKRQYSHTDKRKAVLKRYNASDKARASKRKYREKIRKERENNKNKNKKQRV